jgi:hypothetical protein
MKKFVLLLALLISVYTTIGQNAYSRGFKKGYEKGFCHNQGFGCVPPLSPVVPIPRVGESNDSYNDGYNRGFEMGLNDNKENREEDKNNDDIYKGSTDGYPKQTVINGYNRQPTKYNKTTSSINHELIAEVLRKKQEAIDKEMAYINSLSYAERNALLEKREYSRRKSNLYNKNLDRFYKANKKADKEAKKLSSELKNNKKKFLKSDLLNLSDIKNGWHKTIVNIRVDGKPNFVNRLVYFENGIITKYVGGTGFMAYIKEQKEQTPEIILLRVGYEDSQSQEIYVSFIDNKPIKLKEEPIFPTIIKFYTTVNDGGKFFIYLNGNTYSDYFTLQESFKPGASINCEQSEAVVSFYVKPNGYFDFYAHNDVSEWSGSINTMNRFCIIKELGN